MDTFSSDGEGNNIKNTETWNEILTDYEIEVISIIRGSSGKSTIHLTVEGGAADGKNLRTSGTFYLTEGETYYFFLLYEKRNDKWWAVAGQQGVLRGLENNGESYVGSINGYRVLGLDGKFISDNGNTNGVKLKTEQFLARISTWRHE
jgi:hypothetical protein